MRSRINVISISAAAAVLLLAISVARVLSADGEGRTQAAAQAGHPRSSRPPAPATGATTRPATDWRWFLEHARTKDDQPADATARDRLFGDVRAVTKASASPRGVEILIMESMYQHLPGAEQYDRVQVFSRRGEAAGEDVRRLTQLGFTEVRPADFERLRSPVTRLMIAGGSDNGVANASHLSTDAVVLSRFDGEQWQVETWRSLSAIDFAVSPLPDRRELLPAPAMNLIDLIEALKPYSHQGKGFGPAVYTSMTEQFPRKAPSDRPQPARPGAAGG